MRKFLLALALVLIVGWSWAQRPGQKSYTITLNEKSLTPSANFEQAITTLHAKSLLTTPAKNTHIILQFTTLPTLAEQQKLKAQGISLLNYLQGNAYMVSVSPQFYAIKQSDSKNIRAFVDINPEYKIDNTIANGTIPEYAKGNGDQVKVVITYFKDIDDATFAKGVPSVKMYGQQQFKKFHQVLAEVSAADILKLAAEDWVQNIELVSPPVELQNDHGKSLSRANVLNSSIPGVGFGLTGKGVKIGLWDADVENHRDFNGRVTNREYEMHTTDHGTHTCGTMVSAGLLDPKAQGMAPDATVFAWNFNTQSNGLMTEEERLLSLDNDGIEITSNSWGYSVTTCPEPYAYNSTDHNEDLIASWYPYFLYVFSAGNDQSICPGGFATTSKNMKNSLMVAAIDKSDMMSSFSSFGPSKDGRLIPNISGDGVDVYSTFFNNSYGLMSGTSMATPGVAGTMALVYQRYKDTHGGQRPDASLLRALACNTAKDLGTPGPDYKFGYGEINGLRAVEVMEKNNYFTNSVSQGTSYSKDITIPAGAVALKVFLSWTDPTGTVGSSRILVNDLDLSVTHAGITTLPWVLDPKNPSAPAIHGFDGLNNMEQVTYTSPAAGTYTIDVAGYEVPDGMQDFAVVYDVVMPELKLTYPIGGEYFAPGTQEVIRWDCEGYTNSFTLECSTDGGVNYSVIASNIPSTSRSYLWTVPQGVSKNSKIRISNGSVLNEDKGSFNIMPTPMNVKVASAQCGGEGPFGLTWDAVANARYEILKLNGQVYEHLADAESNSYDITGITQNNNNWYCVRAIDLTTGATSQRSLAVTVNPSVSVAALPLNEKFESQQASNFYFTADKGQGNVRYVNDAQKYGIRLEGTAGATTDWVASTSANCFTNNPSYLTTASICNIDASSLAGQNFRLKFDYREKYRTATGTSFFRVKVNGDVLTNSDGTQIYGTTNQVSYKSVYYDLSAYAGLSNVTIQFEAVCKTNYTIYVDANGNYNFSSDSYDVGDFVTIDNIEILQPLNDLALTSLTAGTGVTNAETISVKIKNLSGNSVSNVPVSYTTNGGAEVNETVSGPIAPMAEATYAFTQKADLTTIGLNNIVATVDWPNDPVTDNNSLTVTKVNNGTDVVMGVTTGTYTTCLATLVSPGGRYSGYPISQNKNITIKPGTAGKNIKVTFTSFALEDTFDFLYVYSGTSATAANLIGKYTGGTLPPTLTSYALGGELYFRFTSDSDVNDWGFVATVECVDKTTDAALTAITSPTASGVKTNAELVKVTVSNPGLNNLTAADVYYQINTNTPVHETVDIVAGATAKTYTFATTADLSVPAVYTLKAWIDVPDDEVANNNSVTTTITSTAAVIPTNDATVTAIATIYPKRIAGGTSGITATIKNVGTVSIVNPTVAYAINGGEEVSQTFSGTIAANGSTNVTFTTKADFSTPNTAFSVNVYTKVSGDANAANDSLTTTVITPDNSTTNVIGTYDGVNDLVTAPASTAVNLTNNYTIECWAKLGDIPTYGRVFDKTNIMLYYCTNYGVAFYGTNAFVLSLTTSAGASVFFVPDAVKLGQWQHIAVTVSGSNVYTLYLDGVAQTLQWYSGSTTPGATTANGTIPLYIGDGSALTRCINGNLDEFRVWNTELSQATIQANTTTDFPTNTAGMLAYYKFIEGKGSYVYDYSSNDNTAVISNADVSGMGAGKFWNAQTPLIYNYGFTEEVTPTVFDAATNTFTSVVPMGTDLSNLAANFATAENSVVTVNSVPQASGTSPNDFTSQVDYTVDGVGFNSGISQTFHVNVSADKNSDCELTSYTFETANNPGLTSALVLDANGSNFYKKVAAGMNLTSLKAAFTLSSGAKLLINGIAQSSPQLTVTDYTNPVMVTVVSANGRTFKNYSITVDARSSDAVLSAFEISGMQVAETSIDDLNHTVNIWLNNSTDVTMLTPVFTVSPLAHVYVNSVTQLNGVTTNDFTNPLVYKVVSEDESTTYDWTVTIANDAISPEITLMGDSPMQVAYGSDFTDPGATAWDNVDGDLTSKIEVSGSVNPAAVGTYYLTYTVADLAGNITVVTRTVNVSDQTIPEIMLIGTSPVTVVRFDSFTDPGATATDNLDGDITTSIVVTGNVNTDVRGTYTLKYNVQDAAGNPAVEVTRIVRVITLTKPVITLLGSVDITLAQGTVYTDSGATALDKEDGDLTAQISVDGSVETASVGTYTLTYRVTDTDGNEAIAVIRTVHVTDQTIPVITLNGTSPMDIAYGSVFTDPGATATDNVDGDISGSVSVIGSVDVNTIGSYTLTYTVQDAAGNHAEVVTREVNVVKAIAAITISDLSVYYDGTPKAVTVTTEPAGLPVTVTYDGSETVPTEVGVYAVVATINEGNYEGTETASFEILLNTGLASNAVDNVKIYSDGSFIYVNIAKLRESAQLTVYGIGGASVYHTTKLTEGLNKINQNFKTGVQVVRVVIDGKTYSAKIVLNQ